MNGVDPEAGSMEQSTEFALESGVVRAWSWGRGRGIGGLKGSMGEGICNTFNIKV